MSIDPEGTGRWVDIFIENSKSVSICMDPDTFDSIYVRIPVYQHGKEIPYIRYADKFPKYNSNTDYGVPYYILMPGETLQRYYDLNNFRLQKGPIQLKLLLPYYHCSDLIDEDGYRAKKDPRVYVMEQTFNLEIKDVK